MSEALQPVLLVLCLVLEVLGCKKHLSPGRRLSWLNYQPHEQVRDGSMTELQLPKAQVNNALPKKVVSPHQHFST